MRRFPIGLDNTIPVGPERPGRMRDTDRSSLGWISETARIGQSLVVETKGAAVVRDEGMLACTSRGWCAEHS
jgi:hypothetical protein